MTNPMRSRARLVEVVANAIATSVDGDNHQASAATLLSALAQVGLELRNIVKTDNIAERLLAKSVRDGECLRWTGAHTTNGYGQMRVDGHGRAVHRLAYELWVGPIPDGLEIDHVKAKGCRFRDCFEPKHLEPVTHAENIARAFPSLRKTHCVRGHELTAENRKPSRRGTGEVGDRCRRCYNDLQRASRAARRLASGGVKGA